MSVQIGRTDPTETARRRSALVPERPLRVCMVHFSNYPVDSRVQRQASALADRGDEVDCVSLSGPSEIEAERGRIRLHGVGVKKRRHGILAYASGYATFFARAARKVAELDRERRFDLVEVHNMPNFLTFAGATAKRRGTPILLDVHDTFPELFATKFGVSMSHPLTRAMEVEERLSAAFADAMMCVTDEAAARLNARGVCVGRTATVMNSPDESVFGPARPPVEFPADGAVRAIYHGGLATRFGIETLVAGVGLLRSQLPGLSLTICGADHDTASTVQLVRRSGAGNVYVKPHPTPFSQIPNVLADCHIGIVPTARDEFTELLLPVKLLEYIHMGLPVVVSRLPVVTNYFSDDEVRYFEPGSARALADAVADVIADPEAARARAVRATRRLEDLSWSTQKQVYLGLVDQLVRARSRRIAA